MSYESEKELVTEQLQRRLRSDTVIAAGALALIGAIIGTVIVEGIYVTYLDNKFQTLSTNKCVQGDNHGQGQQ